MKDDDHVGKFPFCCRDGQVLSKIMNATKARSVQMNAFKVPPDLNRTTINSPQNWNIKGVVNPKENTIGLKKKSEPPPAPPIPPSSQNGIRDSRTFASVAAGGCRPPPPPPPLMVKPIHLNPALNLEEWFSGELIYVGTALSMEHLNTLNSEITIGDEDGFQIKYLGGLKVCLKFRSSEDVESFRHFEKEWLSEFKRGDPWKNMRSDWHGSKL
ncbi:hypothetical protein L2E82_27950 [Cichorium intybus]|uniref:Uncharacterized protein n=1 Tax=Cichorium intybus TaxID=13427 RepID=A0ACB9CU93_CICIN|nr:hypothetical protein L2E82_27950 [Cichorium intybus]